MSVTKNFSGRLAGLGFVALAIFSAIAATSCTSGEPAVSESAAGDVAEHSYLIPLGTGDAVDRGEEVDIMPAELTVEVGEVLELINEDDRAHTIGPFFVGAGESLRQEFTSPGTLEGVCTVNPSGSFVVNVVEA